MLGDSEDYDGHDETVLRDGSHVYELELDSPSEWREAEPQEAPLTCVQDFLLLGAGAAILAVAVLVMAVNESMSGMLALVMAPFGALLRWVLSWGNPYTEPFPVFTLIANILGAAVVGVAGVMMARHFPGDLKYELWSAFGVGFGGCLSTVSTFIAELESHKLGGLRLRSLYAVLSFGLALAVLLPLNAYSKCPV